MAYDEGLAARIAEILSERVDVSERKMFGGIAFMVDGHICCGVIRDDLLLRLGPSSAETALEQPHVRPMDFTGRSMKGFVCVGPKGVRTEQQLRKRLDSALEFVAALPPK
ncbi:MAG TPA: TfoX/Sxy family protein [Actinomycetota bacterium]|nr:TfoX/Sxy family protein [Actinomycetota bacterium]